MMYVTEDYIRNHPSMKDMFWQWDMQSSKFHLKRTKRDWLVIAPSTSKFATTDVPMASNDTSNEPQPPSMASIREAVLRVTKISPHEFLSRSRFRNITNARQLYFYISKKHTLQSYTAIGRPVNGMNHSTVLHGVRQIENLIKTGNERVMAIVQDIERELGVA